MLLGDHPNATAPLGTEQAHVPRRCGRAVQVKLHHLVLHATEHNGVQAGFRLQNQSQSCGMWNRKGEKRRSGGVRACCRDPGLSLSEWSGRQACGGGGTGANGFGATGWEPGRGATGWRAGGGRESEEEDGLEAHGSVKNSPDRAELRRSGPDVRGGWWRR